VLAVIGGCGGAGASVFCAVLALARDDPAPLLVDLDAAGGGIDLLLGIEEQPGARWADLRLGGGELDPAQLADRLPSWGRASVRSSGSDGALPPHPALGRVVGAARTTRAVVLDVPRWLPSHAGDALAEADAAILVVPSEVRAVVAAAALRDALREMWPEGAGRRLAAVVRPGAVELGAVRDHLDLRTAIVLPAHDWLGGDDTGALRQAESPRAVVDAGLRAWAFADGDE
jgi:hypothetical protein